MARVLAIDDDEDMCTLVAIALRRFGYEVSSATSGLEGLKEMHQFHPDAVIIDKMMPGMDGYEVVRRIRRDPQFGEIPILVLTAEENLEGKVDAFEIGADDYINKPFAAEELNARLAALLRRSQRSGGYRAVQGDGKEARTIAVHSLRGGIGSTTVAVNLAVALQRLWRAPTLLVDMNFLSGHISLFLDSPAKRTWADLAREDLDEIDEDLVTHVISSYNDGLEFLAAPNTPSAAELITPENVKRAIEVMAPRYEYIIFDLPHDFDDTTLSILDRADVILLVVAPELAAVRSASLALDTYAKLDYDRAVVKLVLNRPFDDAGLSPMDVARVLRHAPAMSLPFAGRRPVQAINQGTPLLDAWPDHPASDQLASFAYDVSKQVHRDIPPISPSEFWQRVTSQRDENLVKRTVHRFFR